MLISATRRKKALFYFSAIVLASVALYIYLALVRAYGELPHYVLFYPVVLLVAMLGDAWAGLLATTTSALLAVYWVLPPKGFKIERTNDAIGLAIFCSTGVCISVVAELYHRNRRALATHEKEEAVQAERRAADKRQAELLRVSFDAIVVWQGMVG